MVRCTFSPAGRWRPADVARLARTLGIRQSVVWCSSRKCACRREPNSHESDRKWRMPDGHRPAAPEGQSTRSKQQPDFSQDRRERRPVQTRKDAATRDNWMHQHASGLHVSARMNGRDTQRGSSVPTVRKRSKPSIQGSGRRCKAQSALQSHWRAPQTRSTATALAVAQSGKQNRSHANALWPACRAN